ncbi:5-formyltetrahydrofolate cyclo-ligase [Thermosulfurimonas sp. F29]|uniref:5-formyltetrahydrofolate cyclo-ligase n=1 Tax=Thermosulfurimonas sp. F29 TaxID=2867247 RepID=UPI001C82C329|nr:5-formyltetrahydrofolate cyclo-ligase [Thermosulfurimonas sp. F29]MBX6422776.1 5-formyltetrahydrofolate cyclo-ligase [Thermosulfurimonas sp. F29]
MISEAPPDIMELKKQLRKEMLQKRSELSPEERENLSLSICHRFLKTELFERSRTILFFASFGTEVNLFPALGAALLQGKRVGLPRTVISRRTLFFHQIFTLGELVPGPYGILEPPPENPLISPDEVDLVLVPGLAFDRSGYRLGYGGGFYDRFLREIRAIKVAPAFSFQVVKNLPHEKHDLPVDFIITEREIIIPEISPLAP